MRQYGRQYIRFATVGAFIAISAILLREIVAALLPPGNYRFSTSIVIVWSLGILLSFYLNRAYTFASKSSGWTSLARFSIIAIAAGLLCVVISNMTLEVLAHVLPSLAYRETIAFIVGNLLASIASFAAYRRLVFTQC